MAQVLVSGGFPEEAPPLLIKTISYAAAAKLASVGELSDDATAASPAQIADLVASGALPAHISATLAALSSATESLSADEGHRLIEAASNLFAA